HRVARAPCRGSATRLRPHRPRHRLLRLPHQSQSRRREIVGDETLNCRRSPDDEGQKARKPSFHKRRIAMNKFILSGAAVLAFTAAPASAQLLGGVTGAVNGAVNGTL